MVHSSLGFPVSSPNRSITKYNTALESEFTAPSPATSLSLLPLKGSDSSDNIQSSMVNCESSSDLDDRINSDKGERRSARQRLPNSKYVNDFILRTNSRGSSRVCSSKRAHSRSDSSRSESKPDVRDEARGMTNERMDGHDRRLIVLLRSSPLVSI